MPKKKTRKTANEATREYIAFIDSLSEPERKIASKAAGMMAAAFAMIQGEVTRAACCGLEVSMQRIANGDISTTAIAHLIDSLSIIEPVLSAKGKTALSGIQPGQN